MSYIDIHCHLDLCQGVAQVVDLARTQGVKTILSQGVNSESNRKVLDYAKKYPEVKAALGFYPIDAIKFSDEEIKKEIQFIRENRKEVAAIGEVGMDFKEDLSQHEKQKEIFIQMIELSNDLDVPVIVHSRKAEEECIALLEKYRAKKVIMHCFCGKWKLVERIRDNGWFLTVPTNVVHSQQFQSIAKAIPLTQLFCETDAPYLHPYKEWPNEPALVVESYKMISTLKGLPLEDVEQMISQNYMRLFSKK